MGCVGNGIELGRYGAKFGKQVRTKGTDVETRQFFNANNKQIFSTFSIDPRTRFR
jgi:ribosomal protein L37AE/L43A